MIITLCQSKYFLQYQMNLKLGSAFWEVNVYKVVHDEDVNICKYSGECMKFKSTL